MKNTVFYSWQSDLPNNTNRGYIESCIQTAITQLNKSEEFCLDVTLDRDTKDEAGTPDIANTIFTKIEKAKIFIADISIINSSSTGRKTPNPNVLIELGYAAKVLGWDKIICIFNADYGSFEDLPFDIKFRRPLVYSLNEKEKSEVKKYLSKAIQKNIMELHSKGLLSDDINEYIKIQADTQILTIISHLDKILFGYEEERQSFEYVNKFMKLTADEIKIILSERKFLGFQVYKKFEETEGKIKDILDKITFSSYYKREIGVPLVNMIKWISSFDKFNSLRETPDLFLKANERIKGFKAVYGPDINPTNKDGYILLERIDNEHSIVRDFGEFQEKQKIDEMLDYLFINKKYIDYYTNKFIELIEIVNKWLVISGDEFLIDNIKAFEFKAKENPHKKLSEFNNELVDDSSYLLNNILDDSYNFDYNNIVNINSLKYLIESLVINGQPFKDYKIILENLNKEIAATLSCSDNNEIIIPWNISTESEIAIESSIELETNHDRREKNSEYNNISHIYITPTYLDDINTFTKLLAYDSLPKNTKELAEKIINDTKKNLGIIFKEILERFIISNGSGKEKKAINTLKVLEKFDVSRIYHEKDINILRYQIRKYLNDKK